MAIFAGDSATLPAPFWDTAARITGEVRRGDQDRQQRQQHPERTNGSDLLLGGADNDSLNGGTSNDAMDGGAGNDSLNGGSGSDLVSGDTDNDTLVYKKAEYAGSVGISRNTVVSHMVNALAAIEREMGSRRIGSGRSWLIAFHPSRQ